MPEAKDKAELKIPVEPGSDGDARPTEREKQIPLDQKSSTDAVPEKQVPLRQQTRAEVQNPLMHESY